MTPPTVPSDATKLYVIFHIKYSFISDFLSKWSANIASNDDGGTSIKSFITGSRRDQAQFNS